MNTRDISEILLSGKPLPPDTFNKGSQLGYELMYHAIRVNQLDYTKKFILAGLDINSYDKSYNAPFACAAFHGKHDIVEYFLVIGAKDNVADEALASGCRKTMTIAIANGSRLKCSSSCDNFSFVSMFQQGVLRCRDVIVTLLGLKKRRCLAVLQKLDRFLISQVLAVEIWSTRSCANEKWQQMSNN